MLHLLIIGVLTLVCLMLFWHLGRVKRFETLITHSKDAVMVWNARCEGLWQNRVAEQIFGFSKEGFKALCPVIYQEGEPRGLIKTLDALDHFSGLVQIEDARGHPHEVYLSAFRVLNELGDLVCYAAFIKDARAFWYAFERANAEKTRFEQLAHTDPLTGLLNRAAFYTRVQRPHTHTPACAVVVDVDHFKRINDTYGHSVGDEAIMKLSRILLRGVRQSDLVVRWGGEEFVLWLDTDEAHAFFITEKLRQQIEDDATIVPFTVSVGIAEHHTDHEINTTIERADAALYAAKHAGRNRVVRHSQMPSNDPQSTVLTQQASVA